MLSRKSSFAVAVLLCAGLATTTLAQAPAPDGPPTVLLILDASGSMWGQIDGENKIVIARRVLGDLVEDLAADTEVGVIAYGHRREGDCDDIETVVPIGALDPAALKGAVNGLNPKGKTPITRSVSQAFDLLRQRPGQGGSAGATVILVSDGLETCGGDPCATVRAAKEQGIDFVLHIVGFDVAKEDVSSLECAAQAGGGLFLSAENAGELSAALEAAVALPAEIPTGRLAVKVIADGKLQDAAIAVTHAESGEQAGVGRTYTDPGTNPRIVPLPDGKYRAKVTAVGIRGAATRHFEFEIADGATVEREEDFSTGELVIGVTRNGEPSDATFHVLVAGTTDEAASGRTYTAPTSNPKTLRIVSGTYEVKIGSVEISGHPEAILGEVTVEPRGSVAVSHDFASGTLKVGAQRDGTLVDATLNVTDANGKSVAGGRTYTSTNSNPKTFELEPGDYRVVVSEIRGEKKEIRVTVIQGETVERMVDPGG